MNNKRQISIKIFGSIAIITLFLAQAVSSFAALVKMTHYDGSRQVLGYSTYEYNTFGLLSKVSDYSASGKRTYYYTYEYNAANLLSKLSSYDGSGQRIGYYTTEYNAANLISKHSDYDASGQRTDYDTYEYNASGLQSRSSSYSASGQLINYTVNDYNASGLATKSSSYNASGQLILYTTSEYNSSGLRSKSSSYDASGRLTSYVTQEYNASGLMSIFSSYYAGQLQSYITYEYNASGQMSKVSSYNASGQLLVYNVCEYTDETTVATPAFSPVAGAYTAALSVTLSCATPSATIRYTTDNTEPNANSAVYTSSIGVSTTTTIKAKAFKSGWTASATATAFYIISTSKAITASAGIGGTISPSGSVVVNYGASQVFTITPNTGYTVTSVLVDGAAVSIPVAGGAYTFTDVTAIHAISATFTASIAVPPVPYTYATNSGTITITKFTGSGGAMTVPSTINGLPVTRIGDWAFYGYTNLTSVTIPNSVTSIGNYVFSYCTNLTAITVDPLNSVYSSMSGVLFNKSQTTLIQYPPGKDGSYMIPDGVTSIGISAFSGFIQMAAFYRLTSVRIPDSVTSIGDYAFNGCSSLTGVYFGGNAPSLGWSVFGGDNNATVYYLAGTAGWGTTFGGRPTTLWVLPNPVILNSVPTFGVRTNQFGFNISGASNLVIVVEGCTNLAKHIWSPLRTNTLTGGSTYFSDPQWASYPARFYRLRSP